MSRPEDISGERSIPLRRKASPRVRDEDLAGVLEELPPKARQLRAEVEKVVVGQSAAVDAVLYAILSRGHCLPVSVPGLAKTLLVRSMARR